MQPRELYRRLRAHYEEQERRDRLAWEIGITAACIQANRIPQHTQEDGTLPKPLQPSDFLPWVEAPDTADAAEDEARLEAAVERGEALSEGKRKKASPPQAAEPQATEVSE